MYAALMTAQRGFEWDIWPRDTRRARIALGTAGEITAAKALVEGILGGDEDALLGTVEQLFGQRWMCRRSRTEGEYVWTPLEPTILASELALARSMS